MSDIEQIGPHRLLCGDITSGAVERLMGDERADVVYSDPPWGPGALQLFATQSGASLPDSTGAWSRFLDVFARTCAAHSKPSAPVFVEMGPRWAAQLRAVMREHGLWLAREWMVTYGPKAKPLPVTLGLFARTPLADAGRVADALTAAMPSPAHGEAVTAAALRSVVRHGSIVLDLCTGLGMTARWTHKLGGEFRGVELVQPRLARTAAWLRRQR